MSRFRNAQIRREPDQRRLPYNHIDFFLWWVDFVRNCPTPLSTHNNSLRNL
jgi:hypothetical protein